MAKSLKYFYEYRSFIGNNLHKVEIWVEGFSGTAEELQAGKPALTIEQNKTVAEQYLGGLVPTRFLLQAISTATFKESAFDSQSYGDYSILKYTDSVLEYEGIIDPFTSRDLDLPDGMFATQISAECGLNYLKTETFTPTNVRVRLLNVLKACIDKLPHKSNFGFSIVDNTTVSTDNLGTTTANYWDSFVDDRQYKDKNCYDVLAEVLQAYNELYLSKGKWHVRNIAEMNRGNSTERVYSSTLTLLSTTAFNRVVAANVERNAGGNFGKNFSLKNVTIEKPKSLSRELFEAGEFNDLTGWTSNGLGGVIFTATDGKLDNQEFTTYQPSGVDNDYIQNTVGVSFFPFNNLFNQAENDKLSIKIKATSGGFIQSLRFQIIVVQTGSPERRYHLTPQGEWVMEAASVTSYPIYTLAPKDSEQTIEIPKPPYNAAVSPFVIPNFDGWYTGNVFTSPLANLEYKVFIRVFQPERNIVSIATTGGEVLIDYIRIVSEQLNNELFEGFVKEFSGDNAADRNNKLPIKAATGFPVFPQGLETLYQASTGDAHFTKFKSNGSIFYTDLSNHIAKNYLDSLSIRLGTYEGELRGVLHFGDLVAIDSDVYRIHNLSLDSTMGFARVKVVKLTVADVTPIAEPVVIPENFQRWLGEFDRLNPRERFPTFLSENFESNIGRNGERTIALKPQIRAESFLSKTGEVFLLKESNEAGTGLIWVDKDYAVTDSIKPVTAGYEFKSEASPHTAVLDFTALSQNVTIKVPDLAVNSVIATDATAWMRGATNVLTSKDFIGSASGNFDIGIKRNGVEIATAKSTGVDVVGKVKAATVNATSLTTNRIIKSGADGLLSDSLIFDNGTNVGINANPIVSDKFQIYGNGFNLGIYRNIDFNLIGAAASILSVGQIVDAIPTPAYDLIGFSTTKTDGLFLLRVRNANVMTEYIRVLSSGTIGFGTTVPLAGTRIDVNGITRTTNLRITNNAAAGKVWQCSNADGSGVWTSPLTSERYIGEWDAGSGGAPSASPNTGDYYRVNGAGTYAGVTYASGDDTYWNGSAWLLRKNYLTLPKATSGILGGIKIGSTLEIDSSGIVNQKTGVVTAGDYQNVTVDTYGRVTGGTNPTTIAGYGITDYNSLWDARLGTQIASANYWTREGNGQLNYSNKVNVGLVSSLSGGAYLNVRNNISLYADASNKHSYIEVGSYYKTWAMSTQGTTPSNSKFAFFAEGVNPLTLHGNGNVSVKSNTDNGFATLQVGGTIQQSVASNYLKADGNGVIVAANFATDWDAKMATFIDTAPEALDTWIELVTEIQDNDSQIANLFTQIATKQSKFTQNGFVKLSNNGETVNYLTTLAMSDISGLENSLNLLEPKFSKNTAFNKNFGTSSGTVAQGNDSRILNGQTAFGYGNHANAGYLTENFFEHQFSDGSGGVRNEYGLRFYDGALEKGRLTYDIENELVGFATTHVDESGSAFTMRNVFDDAGRLVQINGSGDARAYAFSDEIQSSGGSTTPGLQEVATIDPLTRIRIKYNEGTATSVAAYDFALVSDTQRLRYRANGQNVENYALMSDLAGLGGSATPNLQSVTNEGARTTNDIILKNVSDANLTGLSFENSSGVAQASFVFYQATNADKFEVKSLRGLDLIGSLAVNIKSIGSNMLLETPTDLRLKANTINLDAPYLSVTVPNANLSDAYGSRYAIEKVNIGTTQNPNTRFQWVKIN
jgi:hypothetical protein